MVDFIQQKMDEFDRIYISENSWMSDDGTQTYIPVQLMRNWVVNSLKESMNAGFLGGAMSEMKNNTHVVKIENLSENFIEISVSKAIPNATTYVVSTLRMNMNNEAGKSMLRDLLIAVDKTKMEADRLVIRNQNINVTQQ